MSDERERNDMNWGMVSGLLDVILKAAQAGPEFTGLVAQARAELEGEIAKAKDAAAARVKAKMEADAKAAQEASDKAAAEAKAVEDQQRKLTPVESSPPGIGPGPMGPPHQEPQPQLEPQPTPMFTTTPPPPGDSITSDTPERRI